VGNIVVPQLGESVVEARVVKWHKRQGDRVEAGEPLVELETEKVDLEVRADEAGVISSIAKNEGEDVKVGDVLAVVGAADGAGAPAAPAKTSAEPAAKPPAPAAEEVQPSTTEPKPAESSAPRTPAVSPPAVPAQPVPAAAPQRRAAAPNPPPAAAPAPAPPPRVSDASPDKGRLEERVRMSKRRQTIARRLLEAQQTAAMLTTFNEVDLTAVMELRARAKEDFKKRHGVNLGLTAFFVNASIAALRAFPQLNAEIQGDEVVLKHYYDIGIAVAAEAGLVVPVLRDADRMSFADIETGIRTFAARAADGTLTLEDLRGGTFTITNGGVFGSLLSTPILNVPQVGILGLHQIQDRPIAMKGTVVIRPMMYVALTYDHRLIDGREAVQFLVAVKEYVEDPARLLLSR
jgi:2-oxoglutarate dehydrogenase E2 component (dihydrolipoamide succinyltransferase)